MSDYAPTMVSGEVHGRLTLSALSHGVDPAVTTASQISLVLAFVTLMIVVIDLVTRGRLRRTSLASAHFLTCISPVIAVGAASMGALNQWTLLNDQPVTLAEIAVVQASFALLYGSFFTGLGVVLTLALRLDDAWRNRTHKRPGNDPMPL